MALFSRRPKKPAEPGSGEDVAASAAPPSEQDAAAAGGAAAEVHGESSSRDAGAPPSPEAQVPETSGTEAVDAAAGPTHAEAPSDVPAADAAAPTPSGPAEVDAVSGVSISVSTFGGLGAGTPATSATPATPATPKEAPRPRGNARAETRVAPTSSETIPGLRDNVLLRDALARVPDGAPAHTVLDVARQLLQGHVFLRVKGDARTLLAEGKNLPLAVVNAGERTFALGYSSGAALQASLRADGDVDTSAMGQPVLSVLKHVLAGTYDGLILDHASAPARAVLPRELLQKIVEQADPKLTVKTLLAGDRTPATSAEIAQALTRVPLWVAVGAAAGGKPGLAEGRQADGTRYLEVYSHPLEVAVVGRGDNAAPITATQLAKALGGDVGLSGVVVDPAGPWIRLTRDDLAPVLALAS
ncbi:SseB family protein [Microbacterium sp. HD4P20]|uniref:SseB family protein n=1 Tax=Microbacterium sp. HD4P20 TaxID=2864874 RepID=UPI001C63CF2B|nr:SseB family protein [Microbacterium sp. HD4P20]MCP2635226.1 SseB family protein [Microbacterium sp. HD4P20]